MVASVWLSVADLIDAELCLKLVNGVSENACAVLVATGLEDGKGRAEFSQFGEGGREGGGHG